MSIVLKAVVIGVTLMVCASMGGALTGAALNPARVLGPAIFSWQAGMVWPVTLYVLAALMGGGLAALVSGYLFPSSTKEE